MKDKKGKSNLKYHLLMVFLVCAWGAEFPMAKHALGIFDSVSLITVKYVIGSLVMLSVLIKTGQLKKLKPKHLLICIAGSLLGNILYFIGEYTAMSMVPVANITILLGFLPVGTVILERIIYKRKASVKMVAGMLICVVGILMVLGSDLDNILSGKFLGYVMCFVAVGSWLSYLFITESVSQEYDSTLISFHMTIIATVVTAPYCLTHLPDASQIDTRVILEVLFLGVVAVGLCFMIEVKSIQKLGPTITGVYSNFLPVTTALFGVLMLGEGLHWLQCIGGVVVIASGCFVIREKSKLQSKAKEKELQEAEAEKK